MSEEKEGNPHVSNALCIARMETMTEKIEGLKTTFKVGLIISTLTIALFQLFLELI